ncbi:hypothetical protein HYZ41_00380 [archaeon]|nr:hypothetical protein [archaeon]
MKYNNILKKGILVKLKHTNEKEYMDNIMVAGSSFYDDTYKFIWWDDAEKNSIGYVNACADSKFNVVINDIPEVTYISSIGKGTITKEIDSNDFPKIDGINFSEINAELFEKYSKILNMEERVSLMNKDKRRVPDDQSKYYACCDVCLVMAAEYDS